MGKRALISVWNKDKLIEFAEVLTQKYDYEIVATGSTFDLLSENKIPAKEISEITGKRQLINGKVKTLYPDVFAGILADMNNENEKADIEKTNIKLFDMVVVNFYPFEEAVNKNAEETELTNTIDIGGPSMLRAAAKNNKRVLAVSSPEQYIQVLEDLEENLRLKYLKKLLILIQKCFTNYQTGLKKTVKIISL